LCCALLLLGGCSRPVPSGSLVLAQSPHATDSETPRDWLDLQYPRGSRVVLATDSPDPNRVRVLSGGLIAAGQPVVSFDGRRVVFCGKTTTDADWQIYEADLRGGGLNRLTDAPGGAVDPALLGDGTLLYVSPVPTPSGSASTRPSALYAKARHSQARQLTFGTSAISSPTMLADGRILFVSAQFADGTNGAVGQALYTINNDGTELSAFAGQHDSPRAVRRPRQLEDGRIVFVTGSSPASHCTTAEFVRSANPFHSRAQLVPGSDASISAVQPSPMGDLLVCATSGSADVGACATHAVFRLVLGAASLTRPIFADTNWDTLEAVPASAARAPMGRISNVDPARVTGQILCLDVNNTSLPTDSTSASSRAVRIRVFGEQTAGQRVTLGEVELQPDGSFLAEVPADMALGFDALDDQGRVLRHQSASVWVRRGENRACIGCHEPHNHSPRNFRPLAVGTPATRLVGEPAKLARSDH